MMQQRIIIQTFFLMLCVLTRVYGQYIFQNLREQDGLSARQTSCLYQDKDGFLWIGTANGLNRYDGNIIKRYKDLTPQKDIYVNAIYPIENDKKLLIGTRNGLLIFDKQTGSFLRDRFPGLHGKDVLAIKKDGMGRLWIISYYEIFIYEQGVVRPVEEVLSFMKLLANKNFMYSAFPAFCWDNERQGFWVGGADPFFIDLVNNQVYNKKNNPRGYRILNEKRVTAIAIDHAQNIWYSSNRDLSLYMWKTSTNEVRVYDKIDANFIFVDRENQLWISTWSYSAYFKAPGKPIRKIPYRQEDPNSIAYGHFKDAIEDLDGNLWFATINGPSKNTLNTPLRTIYKLPSFESHTNVGYSQASHIITDGNTIVAAKEDGIVFFDMATQTYKKYLVTEHEALLRNKFHMSAKTKNGWWFAGYDGVYFLKNGSHKLNRFTKVGRTTSNFIFEDRKGNIWFQLLNDALYRYNTSTDRLTRFDGKDSTHGLFNYKYCNSHLKLKNGNLLFPMESGFLLSFDLASEKFSVVEIPGLEHVFTPQCLEDADGNIWLCIWGKGLLKTDLSGNKLDSLNTSNGLLFDQIGSICFDNLGTIWAASPEGLFLINPRQKRATRIEIEFGKTLQDYWNYLTVVDNKVYAVMLDHVVVIDPLLIGTIKVRKPPHITSVKVSEKEMADVETKIPLELAFDQDLVTFRFSSLYHRTVPNLQYSYRLDGIDDDWVNSQRSVTATYNHLPHGKYTFKVRSTDEHGNWMSDIGTQSLIIFPPWWQTWWFRTFMTVSFLVSLWILYINHLRRKQKIVADRTIDYFANSVYGENSIDEICWDIARNCTTYLHFQDCAVYLLDPERNVLVKRADYSTIDLKDYYNVSLVEVGMGEGMIGAVAASGSSLIDSHPFGPSRYPSATNAGRSKISVPILHEGAAVGVVYSENRKQGFFKQEHIKTLLTIASICANKIAEAQAIEKTHQKELMLMEINKMLAESQLMALRAQMNPHFVFNCLNSIQECIVTEKYREASKYLNKFSKLFRLVLNNSDKNMVTIEEEIEVLELYLQLELMRFEESFTFSIILDDELDAEEIVLPSMLLQPYVENALWHGLMHKNGDRKLFIKFLRLSDAVFKCVIEDNGIGRKKSFQIKQQSVKAKLHKSKGLQIAKDRLDLIRRQGQHASVNIIDKYGPDGSGIGTTVDIELSTFLKII